MLKEIINLVEICSIEFEKKSISLFNWNDIHKPNIKIGTILKMY